MCAATFIYTQQVHHHSFVVQGLEESCTRGCSHCIYVEGRMGHCMRYDSTRVWAASLRIPSNRRLQETTIEPLAERENVFAKSLGWLPW